MPVHRPEELTLAHIAKDMGVSLILTVGTVLIELVKALAPLPALPAATLLALEFALVCFALGYAVRAAAFLFDQILFLIDRLAKSSTRAPLLTVLNVAVKFLKWTAVCTIGLSIMILASIALGGLINSTVLMRLPGLEAMCASCAFSFADLFTPFSAFLVLLPLSLILGSRTLSLMLQRHTRTSRTD